MTPRAHASIPVLAAALLIGASLLTGCAVEPPVHPEAGPSSPRTASTPPGATPDAATKRAVTPTPTPVPSAFSTQPALLQLRAVFRAGSAIATVVETVSPPTNTAPAGWSAGFATCASPAAAAPQFLHVRATATTTGSWPVTAVLEVGAYTFTARTVWSGALQPMQSPCTDVAGAAPFAESGDVMVDAARPVDDADQWGGGAWYLDVYDGVTGVALVSCDVTLSAAAAGSPSLSTRVHSGLTPGSTRCGGVLSAP